MRSRYPIAAGLFVASLLLYLRTLAPSVVTIFDDSLEFQLVTYELGIAHPTGYPLYTLLGKLFTLLPVANVAYRVNLMSAVFGAATVALVYLLILQIAANQKTERSEEGRRAGVTEEPSLALPLSFPLAPLPTRQPSPSWPLHLGSIIGALLLAVGSVFWQQATIAEVYTLNAFLVALLLLLTATFPTTSIEARRQRLLWLVFWAGLSLTHHRTILLLLPALALYLGLTQKDFLKNMGIRTAGIALLLSWLPLLFYLYLPWRGQIGSLDGTYQNTWAGFWRQVSAGGYGAFIFGNPFSQERNAAFYWQLLQSQFYVVVPGFIGLFYLLWLGQRKMLLLTGTAFVTYVTFNLFYKVSDIEVFFIPVFLVWAIWSGAGAAFLLTVAATLKYQRWRSWYTGLTLALFLFIILELFQTNRASLSQRYTWQIHDYGLDMLQQAERSNRPAVVGILGEMTLLRYFQQTEPGDEGSRWRAIETVAADEETTRLAAVEKLLKEGKTVYLTRELPGAAERWSLNAVGPLIRVDPKPVMSLPQVSHRVEQTVTPEIRLRGYNLSHPPHTGSGPAPVRLTLFWQARATLPVNLKVSARLLNPAGEPVAVVDAVPVHFAYPTTAWREDEIVSDVYDLILPAAAPPGPYTPLLIWYDPAHEAAEVGRITLEPITPVLVP